MSVEEAERGKMHGSTPHEVLLSMLRWLLIPLFAFMGALIARSFFLDFLEEAAFRAVWAASDYVKIDWELFKRLMRTEPGQKILVGFVIGGVAGFASAWVVGKLSPSAKK